MVITSRSTINSVFFLILDFISVGCLFIMVGAEFLGMIILIVYVGAVAVLFLFVVMMLNVAEQNSLGFLVKNQLIFPTRFNRKCINLFRINCCSGGWKHKDNLMSSSTLTISDVSNTHQLGLVMYTDYILYFQLSGIILLLSMVGAIILTSEKEKMLKLKVISNKFLEISHSS